MLEILTHALTDWTTEKGCREWRTGTEFWIVTVLTCTYAEEYENACFRDRNHATMHLPDIYIYTYTKFTSELYIANLELSYRVHQYSSTTVYRYRKSWILREKLCRGFEANKRIADSRKRKRISSSIHDIKTQKKLQKHRRFISRSFVGSSPSDSTAKGR